MLPDSLAPNADAGAGTVRVVTEPLGGSPLARAIQQQQVPAEWNTAAPGTPAAWTARVATVREAFAQREWLARLGGAIAAHGPARDRLERVARANGVLVTTGQQPGLFGGPVYTLSKALSALALADAIEAEIGVPAAPLFWAATDDADLVEAQQVWIAGDGGAVELRGCAGAPSGTPAATAAQGDLRAQIMALRDASGSAASGPLLALIDAAYGNTRTTIGGAYCTLLEALLGPLGIGVLDASHPAVRAAGAPLLRTVLDRAARVGTGLAQRSAEIRAAGFDPQVDDVAELTPVFLYEAGVKRRITEAEARVIAEAAPDSALGANVLMRPIMESAILPTIAYVAGPGELAYFAQVSALAGALDVRMPVAVPRWSATLVEPRMQRALDRLGINRESLADPHAVETTLARAAMPAAAASALAALRAGTEAGLDLVASAEASPLLPPPVIDGARRRLGHQLDRLERRALAAVKQREVQAMRDVATVRGYFFPGGKRQERALSLIPTLARYGLETLEAMLAEARVHAAVLVGSGGSSPTEPRA